MKDNLLLVMLPVCCFLIRSPLNPCGDYRERREISSHRCLFLQNVSSSRSLSITTRQTSSVWLTNTRQTALNELTSLFFSFLEFAICSPDSRFYFQASKAPLPPAIGYYGTLPAQYLPANRTQTLPHSASMRTYSPTHATDRQKSQTLPPGGGRFILKVFLVVCLVNLVIFC